MNKPAPSPPVLGEPLPCTLREMVTLSVRRYLHDLRDHPTDDLYHVVLCEVEAPLLAEVLRHHEGNQSRAAETLGITRATLRRKLRKHGIKP